MYTKMTYKVSMIFVVVAMLTATIGCDLGQRQAPVSSDAGVLSGSVTGSVKALPINGESISQPLFSTDLSNGYVDIHSVSVDTTNKTVTMTLTHHSGGLQWDRAFAIGFYEEGANQFGFRSILSDQDGALLWEFSYAVDTTDENHWWFSERTLFDEMTMEHRSGLDFTDEIYTINGVSQTFHFNTSDVDELKTLHRDLLGADQKQMQNMLSSSSINDVATILVLKEFDSFYDGGNSLHYNNDGALVVQLLSNDGLAGWLSAEYVGGDDQPLLRPRWADWLCMSAAVCAAIKCPMLANPACGVCGAVVVTCAIMDFFNLW